MPTSFTAPSGSTSSNLTEPCDGNVAVRVNDLTAGPDTCVTATLYVAPPVTPKIGNDNVPLLPDVDCSSVPAASFTANLIVVGPAGSGTHANDVSSVPVVSGTTFFSTTPPTASAPASTSTPRVIADQFNVGVAVYDEFDKFEIFHDHAPPSDALLYHDGNPNDPVADVTDVVGRRARRRSTWVGTHPVRRHGDEVELNGRST